MDRLLWLPALLLLVSTAHADEVPYRRYTVSDGLPNEDIHALAQSTDSRLYVGTPGGLAVYNGQQFHQVEFPDSVGAAGVYHLVADSNAIWAGTTNGWILKVQSGRATQALPRIQGVERLLLRRDTLHIVAKRSYWILPPNAKRPLQQPMKVSFRLPGQQIQTDVGRSLADADIGPSGRLWVLDRRLGPGQLQPDGSVDFADVPRGSPPEGLWTHMRFGPDGTALLRGRQTIYRLDPTTGRLTNISTLDHGGSFYFNRGIAYAPSRNGVARLAWDDSGEIRALPSLNEQFGLPSIQARCVLRDHEGGLWIGTRGGLLHLFAPDVRHISRVDGAPLVYVGHFTRDARGALWVKTWGSGIIRLRPQRTRFTPLGAARWPTVESRDDYVHAMNQRGWFRREPGEGWRRVAPQNGAVRGIVDAEGVAYFWHNRGLYRHDPDAPDVPTLLYAWKAEDNGFHTHTLAPNGDVILRAGDLLLRGTPTDASSSPMRFDTLATLPDYAEDGTRYMAFDARGTAWLAFRHRGLVRVETAGDTARVVSVLPDRPMTNVTLSGDSLVFAGARDGLYVLDQKDSSLLRHLTAADGLLATTTRSAAIYGDTLYVSHPRGLTAMPFRALFRTLPPPDALLTRVERNFEGIDPQAPPRFEADDRTVGLGFAATAFKNPQRLRYEYRLMPHDTTWTTSEASFTRYTDLPPGDYRFEVRAQRANGSFGEATTYSFTIPRYFYETAWFRLLCLLMLGLAGFGAYRWRAHAFRRRQRTLEEKVEHRTEQLRREKRKTQEQAERLAELDAAKNRVFANLSHEFRTPLTLILGTLRDALGGVFGDLPDALSEQLNLMQRNARRLQRLIDQLLDLTKLEAGRMELEHQAGDLVAFVRKIERAFTPMAERKQITLRLRSETDALPAHFDPDKLEQVVSNLLSNALKFTPEGGKVWVTVNRADNSTAEIVVKDTGPGLSEKDLLRIFDRFEQLDGTTTRENEGTGLGLPLARELVELHGGSIHVESEPGFGAAFTVRLPLDQTRGDAGLPDDEEAGEDLKQTPAGDALPVEAAAFPPEHDTDDRTDGTASSEEQTTLLVVEDNADVRAYLRRHLGGDYAIVEAKNGKEGLEATRDHEPDLVLSDVMMPEMDGYELCETVKADEDLGATPIILLTAKADTADAIQGLECGADDYVSKPFDIGELQARIDRLLTSRRRLRRQFSREVHVEPTGAITSEEEASFLEQVLAVVEEHLSEPAFSVDDLAAQMALSRRQLTRRLKDAADETPAALIRRLRLERAAQLLKENEQTTIAEVAYAVGYNSRSHFSKAFRKRFGCPPSDYGAA